MITVVDITDYTQNRYKNYKSIRMEEAIPANVCLDYSRFEILRQTMRRLYIDIDGVKGVNDDSYVKEFIKLFNKFIISSGYAKEPIEFVYTTNFNSAAHPGAGYHLFAKSVQMNYTKNRLLLAEFINENPQYSKTVDFSIYSNKQLYKMPNFIGIPMVNPMNYHTMVDPSNPLLYIVQNTNGCSVFDPTLKKFKAKSKKVAVGRNISYNPNFKPNFHGGNQQQGQTFIPGSSPFRNYDSDIARSLSRIDTLLGNSAVPENMREIIMRCQDEIRRREKVKINIALITQLYNTYGKDKSL